MDRSCPHYTQNSGQCGLTQFTYGAALTRIKWITRPATGYSVYKCRQDPCASIRIGVNAFNLVKCGRSFSEEEICLQERPWPPLHYWHG